jgi:hypothetical protein
MSIIEFGPRKPADTVSLQQKALDEISQKLVVAQKACGGVCELLEAMTELAELVEHLADHPAPAMASRVNLASMRVERKLAALSLLHGQLIRL